MPPRKGKSKDKENKDKEAQAALDDVDDDSSVGGSVGPDDDMKKSSSTQIRKAQNRIAQREFRLRKQQYIRDLEARVEILSGNKEERIELMLLLVRNLLKENKEMRNMVRNMATFIGEGLGSCLPRLGLTSNQLDAILNRADTDTAYEAFMTLKAHKAAADKATDDIHFPPGSKRKRSMDDEGDKMTRDALVGSGGSSATGGAEIGQWDFLFPDLDQPFGGPGPSVMGNTGTSATTTAVDPSEMPFPARMGVYGGTSAPPPGAGSRGSGSGPPTGAPLQPMSAPISTGMGGSGPPTLDRSPITPIKAIDASTPEEERQRNLRAAVAHLTNTGPDQAPSPVIVTSANNMTFEQVEERRRLQEQLRQSMDTEDVPERKTEALQLITYHLNNFRINHEYQLPTSLHPTPVQRTMPHEHAIDGVLFPTIRDRMILLRGRYDLAEAFHGYIKEFTLHGDDVLDHRNYEPSEKWLNEFHILADDEVYAIANRWRAVRGAPPLVRPPESGNPNGGSGLGTGAGLTTEFLNTMGLGM